MSNNSDDDIIPIKIEKEILSAQYNSLMIFNFLMGVYTLIYTSTVYLYMSKKQSGNSKSLVLTLISILFLLSLYEFCREWIVGDTSIPEATLDVMSIVNEMVGFMRVVVADILLIWRCYHVWGGSIRSIAIPSTLFVIECGLYLTNCFFLIKFDITGLTFSEATAENTIGGAMLYISLATTASTSFLIGYRIHTISKDHYLSSSSRKTLNHIVFIIIESAAVYSIFLLAEAIMNILPSTGVPTSVSGRMVNYTETFIFIATGIAPTILFARVSMAQTKTEETCGDSNFGPHRALSNSPTNSLYDGAGTQRSDKPKSKIFMMIRKL